jgi:hypothetical protein
MLEGFPIMERASDKLDVDQTGTRAHKSLPKFAPRRVKTYILLV